ncbi:MAG: 30S ribosomal protein S16 [Bacteroidetes bacterium]|nr:MAG: 30S ribosomal protein S16 [Bacteroidota bacterium]
MPAKIRLQRKGKKGQPFYHIVIADGRAPRDGRFIEKIGYYNPLAKPAEIEINFESALDWLQKGAQPTDTVRAILSYKGVMYKNHLLKGVQKGAMTEEQAEEKFQSWLLDKAARIHSKKNEYELNLKESGKEALAHEAKVNEAKAQALAKKYAKAAAAAEKSEEPEEPVAQEPVAEVPKEEETKEEEPVAAVPKETASAEATAVNEEESQA